MIYSLSLAALVEKKFNISMGFVFETMDFSILDFSDNRNFVGLYLGLL